MKISEILSTPYVFEIESIPNEDGHWVCQAAYGELPDCVVVEPRPLAAIDRLDEKRLLMIFAMIERGQPVPVPREAFSDAWFALTAEPVDAIMERIGLGAWLHKLDSEVDIIDNRPPADGR